MKISYNWLKQLINIDLPLEEVCEKLTMSGLEVEHIIETESIKGGLKNLIVGEVMSKTKHLNLEEFYIVFFHSCIFEFLQSYLVWIL